MAARKPKRFAEGTSVSISKTHEEIRALLSKYGAEGFMVGEWAAESVPAALEGRALPPLLPGPRG